MYPIVVRKDLIDYLTRTAEGTASKHDLRVSYRNSESIAEMETINSGLDLVREEWASTNTAEVSNPDSVEGQLASTLHDKFKGLPSYILSDYDFWRYCSAVLYEFIEWRQPTDKVSAKFPYYGVASNSLGRECVPHRMFNRAAIMFEASGILGHDDRYRLVDVGAADVWKSHILRVGNGFSPILSYEIVKRVSEGDLPTSRVRALVKELRRMRSNIVFETLDHEQVKAIIDWQLSKLP